MTVKIGTVYATLKVVLDCRAGWNNWSDFFSLMATESDGLSPSFDEYLSHFPHYLNILWHYLA